jgi:hypothetical protein
MDAVSLDRLMRTFAEAQHGLVSAEQVRAAGVESRAFRRRASSADWEPVTNRVLRLLGAQRSDEQRALAAVLDVGGGAVASHLSAAALWGLPGFSMRVIEVSRPRSGSHRTTRLGFVHHPRLLPAHHCSAHSGIPVTTLARTVVDLGGCLHPARLEVVVHAAARLGVPWTALADVVDELDARGRPGIGAVRRLVDENLGSRPMESGLEVAFLRLLTRAGMPPPRRQVDLGGADWAGRVDFVYDDARLVLEVNGKHHDDPLQRRRDDRRTAGLVAAGFRVLPLPEELVRRSPDEVVHLVRQALQAIA